MSQKLDDYDFDLPEELIAMRPVRPRPAAKLLVAHEGILTDSHFAAVGAFLRPGDLLVLNNTKVLPAYLVGRRQRSGAHGVSEARIEVNLMMPDAKGDWQAMARPAKKLRPGEEIQFGAELTAEVREKSDQGFVLLAFNLQGDAFDAALAQIGQMPLPPYIARKRAVDARDDEDYQTVFARKSGAVAAPTASLHFDEELLTQLEQDGIARTEVTLHVGAGTFLPVKNADIAAHKMHREWGEVSAAAAAQIAQAKKEGRRVIAVGTTACRLIETAAQASGQVTAWRGETDIFIRPGFEFHATDGLITNFHLPKSTLMMLVGAFVGHQKLHEIYAHAVAQRYRFFSYGDASLLLPGR